MLSSMDSLVATRAGAALAATRWAKSLSARSGQLAYDRQSRPGAVDLYGHHVGLDGTRQSRGGAGAAVRQLYQEASGKPGEAVVRPVEPATDEVARGEMQGETGAIDDDGDGAGVRGIEHRTRWMTPTLRPLGGLRLLVRVIRRAALSSGRML